MAQNNDLIQANWRIPIRVRDTFTEFCKNSGSIAQDACAGALVIWKYLPSQFRERAIREAKGIQAIDKEFWEEFWQLLDSSSQISQREKRKQKTK